MSLCYNWNQFIANHMEIVRDPSSTKRNYIVGKELDITQKLYLKTISYIMAWIRQLEPPQLTSAPNRVDNARSAPTYRLPKINLPTVSVSVLERENFKAQFQVMVNQDVTLTAVQKLVCLKDQLTGGTVGLVANIELNEAS